jgi:uncharacterized protein
MITNIIDKTISYVRQELQNAEGGHDWWHIYRVWKMSKTLAEGEDVDNLVVELSALLHDIADSKFHSGNEEIGPEKAKKFLKDEGVDELIIDHVEKIIRNISFKGGKESQTFNSKELNIVQDADRLDAIGAIGIARAFNYGGFKGRELYNPHITPNLNMTKEEYKSSTAPTLNHFYEKLLLLKEKMNTKKGLEIAQQRHLFMENYLKQFYSEWEGKK